MAVKFQALSSYCSAKGLSIPKDFDIDEFAKKSSDVKKSISYRFNVSFLDTYVPTLKFSPVKKVSASEEQESKFYSVSNDKKIILYFYSTERNSLAVERAYLDLEAGLNIEEVSINNVKDKKKFTEACILLGESLGVDDEKISGINKQFTRKAKFFSPNIVNKISL